MGDIIKVYGPVTKYNQYVCAHCGEEGDENQGIGTIQHSLGCKANEPDFVPVIEEREDPECCQWCGFANMESCEGIISCFIDGEADEGHLTCRNGCFMDEADVFKLPGRKMKELINNTKRQYEARTGGNNAH